MRIFRHYNTEAAFNLACEEVLLGGMSGSTFFVWQNRPSVIVGRNQNTLTEVNAALAESRQIDIVRRRSGGGSVYHDLGTLNFTLIETVSAATLADFNEPVVAALRRIGVEAEFTGRNDLMVAGRKFSGSARYTQGNRVLFHGTILVAANLDILDRVLTPNGEKLSRKGVDSVRSRVINLCEVKPSITIDKLSDLLIRTFCERYKRDNVAIDEEGLMPFEVNAAEQLATERYRQWTWNIGNSPQCEIVRSAQLCGGNVTVSFTAQRGVLTQLTIRGDFFGTRDIAELEQLLVGTPHNHTELSERLATIQIDDYITGATSEDLITLLV
ncbi:MAG: lipoate--protein ligase [Thermoguttaceae bacterium]